MQSYESTLGREHTNKYVICQVSLLPILHPFKCYDWPISFRKKDVLLFSIVIYIKIAKEQQPFCHNFSMNINFLSICILQASFTHKMTFYQFSPFKCIDDQSGHYHTCKWVKVTPSHTNFVEFKSLAKLSRTRS